MGAIMVENLSAGISQGKASPGVWPGLSCDTGGLGGVFCSQQGNITSSIFAGKRSQARHKSSKSTRSVLNEIQMMKEKITAGEEETLAVVRKQAQFAAEMWVCL